MCIVAGRQAQIPQINAVLCISARADLRDSSRVVSAGARCVALLTVPGRCEAARDPRDSIHSDSSSVPTPSRNRRMSLGKSLFETALKVMGTRKMASMDLPQAGSCRHGVFV
jgi:hypothetical protein